MNREGYMNFGKKIISIVFIVVIGVFFYRQQQLDGICDMNYERDFSAIENLFHKGDNWYWMISDYSRKVGFSLEFMLKNKTSSQHLKLHDLITKVLYVEGKLAGFIGYYPKSPYTWQFLFLLVDQDFRGKGFAKQLLKYAVDDMVHRGAIKIDLVTRVDNARSQGLYQKFGFKKTGETEEHVLMAWRKDQG
tara:strand:+ start:665 stop:1237 length:573 start_codon:yes stop_codon:yes gene_type:complete